jgi:hypothetical protein
MAKVKKKAAEPTTQVITDNDIIDFTLKSLYANATTNELHFEKDILSKVPVKMEPAMVEHLMEVLMSTNLVNASIGFGKNGNFYLSNQGMQVMKNFQSYHAFRQFQQSQQMGSLEQALQQAKADKLRKAKQTVSQIQQKAKTAKKSETANPVAKKAAPKKAAAKKAKK